MLDRRTFLGAAGGLAATSSPSFGQNAIPDRQVRMIVGFGSGNGTDVIARELGPQLERRVGRRITVENRPGESGATAGEALRTGPNDGSFLALLPSTTIASRLGDDAYPFDPQADAAPISLLGRFPLAIAVSPKTGVTNFEDYLKWLGEGGPERGQLGSTAASKAFIGAYGKMMSGAFRSPMKIVGYRGGALMVDAVADGRVPACISNLPTLLAAHRGSRVRIVLLTGSKRAPAAPQIPTAAERGVDGLDLREWYMLFTGGRVPEPVVEAWSSHVRYLLAGGELKAVWQQLGLEVETSTPSEAREIVSGTLREWRQRMEALGVLSRR